MEILLVLEYVGIASASLSGFLFAVKKGCDLLGLFIAAFLTGLGGGVIRDIMVARKIYSFTHYIPVLIVLFMISMAILFKLYKDKENLEKKFLFITTDAIDVICFSIVGSIVAIQYDFNIFGVILVAFSNGVGGGILRDVLLNEVPWLLHTGLYGTISMLVGLIYYVLHLLGLTNMYFVVGLVIFGVIFRLFAYYKSWSLPKIGYEN